MSRLKGEVNFEGLYISKCNVCTYAFKKFSLYFLLNVVKSLTITLQIRTETLSRILSSIAGSYSLASTSHWLLGDTGINSAKRANQLLAAF